MLMERGQTPNKSNDKEHKQDLDTSSHISANATNPNTTNNSTTTNSNTPNEDSVDPIITIKQQDEKIQKLKNLLSRLNTSHESLKTEMRDLKEILKRKDALLTEAQVTIQRFNHSNLREEDSNNIIMNESNLLLSDFERVMDVALSKYTNTTNTIATDKNDISQLVDVETTLQKQETNQQNNTTTTVISNDNTNSSLADTTAVFDERNKDNNDDDTRIEHLENRNRTLLLRLTKLEKTQERIIQEKLEADEKIEFLRSELSAFQKLTVESKKELQEKVTQIEEMQLEIDLMNNNNNVKDNKDNKENHHHHVKQSDSNKIRAYSAKDIHQLEEQVLALKEWATASAEAKQITAERNRELEQELESVKTSHSNKGSSSALQRQSDRTSHNNETIVWTKDGSLAVGAGALEAHVVELTSDILGKISETDILVLKWKFDVKPSNLDIIFSAIKGRRNKMSKYNHGYKDTDIIINKRKVLGGAAGEIENAFDIQNSCTLVWSNEESWVRPRIIKFDLQVVTFSTTNSIASS